MNPNRGSVLEVIGSTQGRLDLYPIYIFIDILLLKFVFNSIHFFCPFLSLTLRIGAAVSGGELTAQVERAILQEVQLQGRA